MPLASRQSRFRWIARAPTSDLIGQARCSAGRLLLSETIRGTSCFTQGLRPLINRTDLTMSKRTKIGPIQYKNHGSAIAFLNGRPIFIPPRFTNKKDIGRQIVRPSQAYNQGFHTRSILVLSRHWFKNTNDIGANLGMTENRS